MSLKRFIKCRRGSFITEAALTLPVFILCVTALALILRIIAVCENITSVTAGEVRDMDIKAYSLQNFDILKEISLCRIMIEDSVFDQNPSLVDFEVKNLDYLYADNNIYDLIAVDVRGNFKVMNPVGINGRIVFDAGILTRGFTGRRAEGEKLDEAAFNGSENAAVVVVFPKYGIRYHLPSCRYVKQEYEGEEYRLEMQKEDAKRKEYTPCLVCMGGRDEQ